MIACPTCGAQNDPGNRFCDQCGTRLQAQNPPPSPVAPADMPTAAAPICPACGAAVLPGEAFCDNCGADLSSALAPMPIASPPAVPAPTAPIAHSANGGTCWSCGAAVLPGERFCDNCGADLEAAPAAAPATPAPVDEHDAATIIAPPAAAPAPEPEPPPPAPVDEHDAATIIAPPAAAPAPEPEPVAPVPAVEPPAPAPVDEHDAATIIAPPAAAPAPEPEPPAPVAMPEPPPPAPAPVAETAAPAPVAPPPPAPSAGGPQRSELEAEVARQQQIITQFEQMQATFGAATPPAVLSGLDEARQALVKAQDALAALPATPAADPAVIKGLEDEIARQRQIITQFEQMQATFGAATPAAVLAGLDEARQALAHAEGELSNLGVSVAPAAAPAPPPAAAPAPAAAAPTPAPPAAPAPGPRLIVADGGQVISLPTNKSELIVGREDPVSNIYPEVDLTSFGGEAGGVSRQHARILHNDGAWMLCDLNSTNYTRIDGARLEPNQPKPLHDGARVQFGRVVLTFHL